MLLSLKIHANKDPNKTITMKMNNLNIGEQAMLCHFHDFSWINLDNNLRK
jgi:hypothetical protein